MKKYVRTRFLALSLIAYPLSTTLAQPIECFDPNVQQSGYTGPVIEGTLTIMPPEPTTLVTPEDMERFERENPTRPSLEEIPRPGEDDRFQPPVDQVALEIEAERMRELRGGRTPSGETYDSRKAERASALARGQPCEPGTPPAQPPKGIRQ